MRDRTHPPTNPPRLSRPHLPRARARNAEPVSALYTGTPSIKLMVGLAVGTIFDSLNPAAS
jgi:hypothetical protein